MKKRILSVFMALCMMLTLLPATALAADSPTEADLEAAERCKAAFETAHKNNTMNWDILFNGVGSYSVVKSANKIEGVDNAGERIKALKTYYEGIKSLSLAGKQVPEETEFKKYKGLLAELTGLETLDLSNTGINQEFLGALVGLSLKDLDLSGNQQIVDLGGLLMEAINPLTSTTCANNLTTLNISNTGVTTMNFMWNGSSKDGSASMGSLKTLTAQGLELTSVAGLVEIAKGGNVKDLTWDLSGSSLTEYVGGGGSGTLNAYHLMAIQEAFAKEGAAGFTAPEVPPLSADNPVKALQSAMRWYQKFRSAYQADGSGLDWRTLSNALYWYTQVENQEFGSAGAHQGTFKGYVQELKTYYESIETLDLSGKEYLPDYSTGAIADLPNLKTLDLSNTGIVDIGGVAGLTNLESLDVSGNQLATSVEGGDDMGALAKLSALKELDISGNQGITSLEGFKNMTNPKASLETLNISDTGITDMNFMWDGDQKEKVFSALKSLTADNLTLTSIAGLVEIVNDNDPAFDSSAVNWDLSGSKLADTGENRVHLEMLKNGFIGSTGKLQAPAIPTTLTTLTVTGGTLTPAFQANITNYTVNVANSVTSIGVTATAAASATIRVNGQAVTTGTVTVQLAVGKNTIAVTVQSGQDQTTLNTYTITVTRAGAPSIPGGNQGSTGGSSGSSSSGESVTVDRTTGGSVQVRPGRAESGETVTIIATPNDGYEVDEVTVTDRNGKELDVRSAGDNRYTFTMPSTKVDVKVDFVRIGSQKPAAPSFWDVSNGAYYADAVRWAVEQGITTGTTANTFSPNSGCTRAQIVTFLWRAKGSPAPRSAENPFTDVNGGAYYADAVLWAVEQGITGGTAATTFSPDSGCTRAQAATFLWRASGSPAAGESNFSDVADSAYYADAVDWAVANSVTQGTAAGTFSPNAACTRAQIVTFLYRAMA